MRINYNYFRDYDSAIGRYVESDPLGLKGGINTFTYVANSPIAYVDPRGLERTYSGCAGNLGLTVCDGNGGFEIRNCGSGCVRECVNVHEAQHVADYGAKGRCRNRPKGASPTLEEDFSGNNFFYRSECKAFVAGKKCAEALKKSGCCEPGSLDGFIRSADYYLRYYKCDQLMRW